MIAKLKEENLDDAFLLIRNVISGMEQDSIDQWDEIYPDRNKIRADLIEGSAFGYFSENSLVGYIVLNETYSPEYDTVDWKQTQGKFLIVQRLCVQYQQQGKGIAKKLLAFTDEFARNGNYLSIRLDSFSGNPRAVKLYESNGYRKTGDFFFRKGLFYCFEKVIGRG